ncbi:MAG TPA: hypothetical protein VLH86_04135 [Patescibacteria group bacterium]|nr:hypothetical protein [Patescibacteria group bacterium]
MKERKNESRLSRRVLGTVSQVREIDLNFDELYDNFSQNWQYKAQQLQARRWRKIRNQTA